ncbi:MAG TPA: putative glycolipid-binding domain-containing protein [Myxococcaceae bacterium]
MTQTRRWRRLDLPAIEEFEEDGRTFRGRVQVDEIVPWSVAYSISFDAQWVTLGTEVSVQRAGHARQLQLQREPSGRWLGDDCEVEPCRGTLDVDLGVTPSTNTSAIRRLGLAVGASAELTATWVRFPDLTVQPLPQRYTRLADRTYLYESLRDGVVVFHARLEVDGTGLVERYEGLFERIV